MRHTYTSTYALLEISEAAYLEIKGKLEAAGYADLLLSNPEAPAYPHIVMTGIALVAEIDMTPDSRESEMIR